MKILVDFSGWQLFKNRGIGRYLSDLFECMHEQYPEIQLDIALIKGFSIICTIC